jgi:putative ABC transport system permease protein
MTPGRGLRIALRIVNTIALLVPPAMRGEWQREWDAELRHQSAQLQRTRTRSSRSQMSLIGRAFGSLPDAAWLRRQFTLDADAIRDAAHGVRLLLKSRGFTAIVLVIFAVAIGSTTAIVSIADALFMRPMVVSRPDRVMTIWQVNRETGATRQDIAPANAIDVITRARSFDALAVAVPFTYNLNFAGREPDYLPSALVSKSFFTVIGTSVMHGRLFEPQEYERGGARVVILSHVLWANRFGSDPAIVGQTVRLDEGNPYQIVGVMPPGLELRMFNDRARRPEPLVWTPKQGFTDVELTLRGPGFWNLLGRLRPEATVVEAQSEIEAIAAQLAREYPQTNGKVDVHMVPLRSHLVGSLQDLLPLLFGAVTLLLVVACANVANLLLARGAARGREFAVRQALGASRVRLVRQMLVESLLLAVVGGGVGLLLARWILDSIGVLRPGDIALIDRIPIDGRAALIACGVTIVAAVVAGLTPALQLSRPSAALALREGRTGTRRGVRGILVVIEVASAVILAVGAGLLVRSFLLVQSVDPGFIREDVAVVQVFASRRLDTPQKRILFFEQAVDRMRALPDIVAAGAVTSMPFGEARVIVRVPLTIAGRPPIQGEQGQVIASAVSGDYFKAMHVPLVEGRLIDGSDTTRSRQVALVSRGAARQFWPDSNPIGSKVRFRFTGTDYDAEVVGIVGDVQHEALDRPTIPEIFIPYAQSGFYALTLVARAAPGSPLDLQRLKEQVWAVDPLQSIYNSAALDGLISKTLGGRRFNLFVLGGFALATLVLAWAGVYGLMSFSIGQRTRELGLRLALGAERRDIITLVLGEGLKLAGLGVGIGLVLALWITRGLRTLLFNVTTTDPMTFVLVTGSVILLVVTACYVPLRRALRVQPAEALRFD